MPLRVSFSRNVHLIWFAVEQGQTPDYYDQTVKQGEAVEIQQLVQLPYLARNTHDFTGEYRLEREGYYSRFFSSRDCELTCNVLD